MKSFEDFHRRFQAKLRLLREARGLRQQDLEEAGVNMRTFQHVEAGDRLPKLDTLYKLALALDVHPAELLQVDRVDPNTPRASRGGPRTKGQPVTPPRGRRKTARSAAKRR